MESGVGKISDQRSSRPVSATSELHTVLLLPPVREQVSLMPNSILDKVQIEN